MKSLSEILLEKLKVTKSKPGDCTLEEFLVWYYFNNNGTIEELTFEEFSSIDFEPNALEAYFDNSERKLYDFLMDHLDEKIRLQSVKDQDYICYRFFIDDKPFEVEYNGNGFWKK